MNMIFSKLSIINNKIIFSCKQQFTTSNCIAWVYNFENINKIKCRSSQRTCSVTKAPFKNFVIFTEKHLYCSLAGFQVLRTPILKTSGLDQGATEMFILEFKNKESLCNAMSENVMRKKASFIRLPELSKMSDN